jgi:hypothetical protein
LINLGATIQRGPLRFLLEKAHGSDIILRISGESMIDARRQNDEITLLHGDANPLILGPTDIKKASSIQDIPNLLVLMQVLVKEHLHLPLVHGAHRLRRYDALIAVLVAPFLRELVDRSDLGIMPVKDTDGGKVGFIDGTAGIVQLSLVTGLVVVPICPHCGEREDQGFRIGLRIEQRLIIRKK